MSAAEMSPTDEKLATAAATQIRRQYKFRFYIDRSMYAQFERLVNDLAAKLLTEKDGSVSYSLSPLEFAQWFQLIATDIKQLYAFDDAFLANISHLEHLMKLEFAYSICQPETDPKQTENNLVAHFHAYIRKMVQQTKLARVNNNFLNFVPSFRFDAPESYRRLRKLASTNEKVDQLVKCCRQQLETMGDNWNADRWCLSFNGGKDCTVLLHVLATLYQTEAAAATKSSPIKPVNLLCIKTSELFEEQEQFLKRAVAYYGCRLHIYPGVDLKSALIEVRQRQSFETIFMGCRRTDFPVDVAAKLTVIQRTDPGWPEFIRVNPLLDWSFTDIWSFLLALQVPYCPLYDYGYTSIDRPDNTGPHPLLKIAEPVVNIDDYLHDSSSGHNSTTTTANAAERSASNIYLPAYLLPRDDLERSCRHHHHRCQKSGRP